MPPSRLHDLKSVHLDIKLLIDLLKSGYRFDDQEATAIIQQMEKSLEILRREISQADREYSTK